MADFPTSPSTGDFFVTPGATYEYTGNAWTVVGPDAGVRISSVQEISATASAPVEEIVGVKSLTLQSGSVNAEPDVGKLFIEDNGPDSYTKLLLHFDGADEATSTTDSSDSSHSITMTGAKIDNGASVFGTSSAYFDGSDSITIAGSTDFDFGTDDFTIEFWMSPDNTSNWDAIISSQNYYTSGYNGNWVVDMNSGNIRIYSYDGQSSEASLTATTSLSSEWQHIALVRNSGTLTFYINGVSAGSTSNFSSRSLSDGQNGIKLGTTQGGPTNYDGYIDELRISKGVARYTSNFDLPTKQFGRPELKIKDGSGDYIIKLKQIN